jgi:hypothetical protein
MADEETSDLSDVEFRSLADLAAGADVSSIPSEHRRKLIKLELLKKSGIEFRVTSAGRLRVTLGR